MSNSWGTSDSTSPRALADEIRLAEDAGVLFMVAAGNDGVAIKGRVAAHAFRGETWHLRLDVGGDRDLLLSIPSGQSLDETGIQAGQQLTAYAATRHIHSIDGGSNHDCDDRNN